MEYSTTGKAGGYMMTDGAPEASHLTANDYLEVIMVQFLSG